MVEQTSHSRARETSGRVYSVAVRGTAALVVLVIFTWRAYLVSIDQIDGGALLLSAGAILGYILSAAWHRN